MFIPYKIEEEHEFHGRAFLVYSFCIVYIAAYIFLYHVLDQVAREDIFYRFGCVPVFYKWWSPLTCTYLHGNLLHLIGNLYFFWIYGRTLERAIGTIRFILLYLGGAFVSVWIHVLTVPVFFDDVPTIGASGAISAVLGAFLVIFPKLNVKFLVFSIVYSRPLPAQAPAYFVLGSWFIVQLAYGLQIVGEVMGVAFWAHIGGFAFGTVIGSIYMVLHHFSSEKIEVREVGPLKECWNKYLNEDNDGAREILENYLNKHEGSDYYKGCRLLCGVLEHEITDNQENAVRLIVDEFTNAKSESDYGMMFQCYYFLNSFFPEEDLPAWLHRDAAIAAMQMNCYNWAIYAYYRAIKVGVDDRIEQLISGIGNVLEKLGLTDEAEIVRSLK